jgi:hypothetical protein
MALSLEDGNKVWQKVNKALADAEPAAVFAFRGLKQWLAEQKGNPQLQFVTIDGTVIDTATNGQDHGIDAAHRIYGLYLKKANTATDTYFAVYDDATNVSGGATDARMSIGLLEAKETFIGVYPDGLVMADGLISKGWTDFDGTTDANEADTPNGFYVLGAS